MSEPSLLRVRRGRKLHRAVQTVIEELEQRQLLTMVVGDDFADALAITGSSATLTASNVGATSEANEPLHAGEDGGVSVWWVWTAPAGGQCQIDTTGSNFDTLLAVYTGSSLPALTEVASNDQNDDVDTSLVTFDASPGTVYRIAVDGYYGDTGDITLHLNLAATAPSAPTAVYASKNCTDKVLVTWTASSDATAYELWRGTTSSSSSATKLSPDPTACSFSDTTALVGKNYWYWVKAKNDNGVSGFGAYAQGVRTPMTDLAATSLSATPVKAAAGDLVKATRAYSVSLAASPDFCINYHLSTNKIWGDSDDITVAQGELVNQPAGKSLGAHTATANLIVPLTARATTYYLLAKVDSTGMVTESNESNNVVVGSAITVTPPSNDAFAKRPAIVGSAATCYGVNANATSEVGERYHARLIGGKSVWWTWTAPAWGQVTIDTIGSTFDTLLGVYTGSSLPALVSVACNNDLAPGITASSVTFSAVAAKAYHIAVDGRGGAIGSIKLNLKQSVPPPAPPAMFATRILSDRVNLSWTASTTATAYDLYRGTSNNSALAARIATDLKVNGFSDSRALTAAKYWYWVKAKNANGSSAFSPGAQGVRVPAFGVNSADASNVAFLHAANGTVRTFAGQGEYAGITANFGVSTQTLLGVQCVRYALTVSVPGHDNVGWGAKDVTGRIWIFKETENNAVVFQAASLADLIPASSYNAVIARLMSGSYSVGTRLVESDGYVAEIMSVNATSSAAPGYYFVAVKDYRPDGSDVSWRYFTESVGQVAEIWDPSGDISASGWILQGFPP